MPDDTRKQWSKQAYIRYFTAQQMEWYDSLRPCFPFLSLHYGDFNLSQSEENQLHMEQTSGFQDC